jgi:hypothetical protein
MTTLNKAALAALLAILVGVVGHFDAEDADAQQANYCSMVATWHAQAKAGVPANDSTGWPPYDGECK